MDRDTAQPRDTLDEHQDQDEREPRPGEVCECGRPAVTVYRTARFGDVPWCGFYDAPPGTVA